MKLAVLFPGIGYHVDKPLLYYGRKLAVQRGYEVVGVPYGNFPDGVKGSPENEAGFSQRTGAGGGDSQGSGLWKI